MSILCNKGDFVGNPVGCMLDFPRNMKIYIYSCTKREKIPTACSFGKVHYTGGR